MLKNILVPLDGCSRAERALPAAARIARASKGRVLLVQVISPPLDYASSMAPVPLVTRELIEAELKEVAYTLTHESTLPVLVLRQTGTELCSPLPDTCGRLTRAFVSLDGSELAEAVLEPTMDLVLALSAPAPAAIHLMQVVKVFPASEAQGRLSELNEQKIGRARAYLATVKAHLQQHHPEAFLAITCSVGLDNDVAGALIETAEARSEESVPGEARGCDLIAMSTHGRGGIQRWMVGSITERVLKGTHLPMLIVRPRPR